MPKLYEYLGIVVSFYANDHEPIHVHGEYGGRENKAEIIVENGKIIEIRFVPVAKRRPLPPKQARYFRELVEHYEEIVNKWVDFFILKKTAKSIKITRRIQ